MDIYCGYCGEPWDNDELHDMESHMGENMPYLQAAKRFKALGCNAFSPDTGMLREKAGLPSKPKHCTIQPILPTDMLRHVRDLQDMSDYPDEWADPVEIGYMLEAIEEILR